MLDELFSDALTVIPLVHNRLGQYKSLDNLEDIR
jgi:hypothetical protein